MVSNFIWITQNLVKSCQGSNGAKIILKTPPLTKEYDKEGTMVRKEAAVKMIGSYLRRLEGVLVGNGNVYYESTSLVTCVGLRTRRNCNVLEQW